MHEDVCIVDEQTKLVNHHIELNEPTKEYNLWHIILKHDVS